MWPGRYDHYYTFPQKYYHSLKSGQGLSCIKSLRSLSFNAVNVTGELLEHFIHNCPLLDRLCVAYSSKLVSLKVVGSSIQLKYLDVQSCYNIEKLKISAPGLQSFKYFGREIKLHAENVPQLVDVCIQWRVSWVVSDSNEESYCPYNKLFSSAEYSLSWMSIVLFFLC